jgi:hypothetical protein
MSIGIGAPHARPASERAPLLSLHQVTLCAASSINVKATVRALKICMEEAVFASCKLFTDAAVELEGLPIEVVPIEGLWSSAAYSDFLLSNLVDHVQTSHCLVVQWDGHVLDASRWRPEFLDFDYIGARWPQFSDDHDVGNGGFSLRSRRLMEACRNPTFQAVHPEDLAIGRINREWLESRGMRFAPREVADLFAAERAGDVRTSFGYHGVFNMPRAIGTEAFWDVYRELDNRGTVHHDFADIARQITRGRGGARRLMRMLVDRARDVFRK